MSLQDTPISELFDRPKHNGRTGWLVRIAGLVVAVAAGAIWLGVVLLPKPWWVSSGFASDPGFFIRKNTIAYPICQPWSQTPSRATEHIAWLSTNGALAPGKQADLALLLPRQAEILRVDCGASGGAAALKECSLRKGCQPPVTVMLDDDLYTRGRAIEISTINRAGNSNAAVGFRILWRERKSGAAGK